MPLDAICISALARELNAQLSGGRIDKVQQPEKDMLLLSVRAGGQNLRLLLSAGTGSARAHLTAGRFENPAEPPMFCMFLRKHLSSARILSVEQPDYERMLVFRLETFNELGLSARKDLIVEMIGRSANVILTGEDGRILDCMRRLDFGGEAERAMQPGRIYRLPPKQKKQPFFETDAEERLAMIASADRSRPMDAWLLDSFAGLSPLICRELSFRCGGDWELLPGQLDALAETVEAGELRPYLLFRDGKPADLSFLAIRQYGEGSHSEAFGSFSELLDAFYSRRDRLEQQRRRARNLSHSVRTARDRIARKLGNQREELQRTEDRESVRRQAELLTANLYRLKKGESSLRCVDYFDPACPEVLIPLDPLKTPQQNAAGLFKEYRKLKAAREHLNVLVAENEKQLEYLNSVLDAIDRAESERDLADLRRELTETGFLRPERGRKPDRSKLQAPRRFASDEGYEILVGRNNLQNDQLTFSLARRTDWWLHTQKVHGSHVILRCEGQEPPELSLRQAAAIAAYYSQAREAGKTLVDYTMVRKVRKPSGSLPGKVIYTEYRSIAVQADEELIARLKR